MKYLLLALAALLAPQLAMSADAPKAALAGKTVVVVSDSLTNDTPENWLALAGARLPETRWFGEAHGGWSTRSYFKAKFDGVAFAKVPKDADVLIVLLGSNNLFEAGGGSDAAVAEAVAGVEKIVAHVRGLAPGVKDVMLVAPPTVLLKNRVIEEPPPARRISDESPAYLKKLGAEYRRLAAARGWRFVDLFPVLEEADFVDAAHPNAAGNRKLADAILAGFAADAPRPAPDGK